MNVVLDKEITKLNSIEFLINKTTNRAIYNEARQNNGNKSLLANNLEKLTNII